jgi:DNA recombination protein RmuC
MTNALVLLTIIVVGAMAGWILASVRAARTAAVIQSDLDEARLKLATASEEGIRLGTLRLSEQQLAAERVEEIGRLKLIVVGAEAARDTERARAAALDADVAGLTATIEALRASQQAWASAATASEAELKASLAEASLAADAARTRAATLDADVARLTTVVEQERKAHAERMQAYLEAEDHFKAAVKATAADALSANNEAFMALAQVKLGDLQHLASADFQQKQKAIQDVIGPVSTLLAKLQADVQLAEQQRVESRTAILTQVQHVATLVPALQRETSQLSRALRHSGTRGRWGELQLRRTLELAGLIEGEHYSWQQRVETEDGRLIPDVIVHLPGGGNIVVDAKTPMQAFLDACAADDDETKARLLEQHSVATRQHIVHLSSKGYCANLDPSPDFVVMYLPVESAFAEVMRADFTIMEDASKRDVMLAGPLVLIPLLRAVAFGWRQHRVAERAAEIAEVGALLYDRIATIVDHFVSVGRGLDRTVDAYNKSVASLDGRLMPTARALKALHVNATKVLKPLEPIDHRPRLLALPECQAEGLDASAAGDLPGVEASVEHDTGEPADDAPDGRTH